MAQLGSTVVNGNLSVTGSASVNGTAVSLNGHTHSYAGSSSAGGAATSANKLNTNAGNTTTPVYFSSGVPVALSYTIAKSVPSDAKFTDTTYESKSAASGGTALSLVTTGEKYTWNNKSNLSIGNTSTTAAAGNHTHATSLTSGGTSTISLSANTAYTLTAGGTSVIFKTPSDTTYSSKSAASGGTDVSLCTTGEKYTWNNKSNLTIGTTSTTAAAGDHTHTTTIATSTGTNQISLAASTKYSITAGGTSYIFTTPPNTRNTAGTDDWRDGHEDTDYMYLIGADDYDEGSRSTYTHPSVYAKAGYLYSNGTKVLTTSDSVGSLECPDTRSTNPTPASVGREFRVDFKSNSTIGLSNHGTYSGVITFRSYGSNTDFSGGPAYRIALADDGAMLFQTGNSSGWGSWSKLQAGYADSATSASTASYATSASYASYVGDGSCNLYSHHTNEVNFGGSGGGGGAMYFGYRAVDGRAVPAEYRFGTSSNANIYAGGFYVSSKRALKENIEIFKGNALDILNDVNVVSYTYISDKAKNYRVGFIADDTSEILSGKDHDKMDSSNCIGVLIKAVQELKAEVEELKKQLKKQEA